jgi:arsenate reductase
MAEGLLRHFGGDSFESYSAGSEPTRVNKNAIKVLAEIGIDLSGQRSESMDEYDLDSFDYIITTCGEAKEACPVISGGKNVINLNFKDPAKLTGTEEDVLNGFRRVRDEIKKFVTDFCNSR